MNETAREQLTFFGRLVLVIISIPVGLIALLILAQFTVFSDRVLDGPRSSAGFQAQVHVSDRGFGPGADYESDVVIVNSDGTEVARWRDEHGGYGDDGAKQLLQSITWLDATTLQFRPVRGDEMTLTTANQHKTTSEQDEAQNPGDG